MQTFVKILLRFDKVFVKSGLQDTLSRPRRPWRRLASGTRLRRAEPPHQRTPTRSPASVDGWATTPSLFPGLVLGWINADFRVQIRILQHFSSSTRKSSSREQICKLWQNFTEFCKFFDNFLGIFRNMQNFEKIYKSFV